jgi:hypothetical protein
MAKQRLLRDPAVQMYLLVSLASLGVIGLLHASRTYPILSAMIVFVGLVAVFLRLSSGPLLLLGTYALIDMVNLVGPVGRRFRGLSWFDLAWHAGPLRWAPDPADMLLCFAFLAFALAQYRLLGLTQNIFPIDPRQVAESRGRWRALLSPRVTRVKRPTRLATAEELAVALIAIPLCVALAHLCWYWLTRHWQLLGQDAILSRYLVVAWTVLALVLLGSAVVGWWRNERQGGERAELFLQDVAWRETRGEQRRINRWLAWARLRREGP